MRNLLCILLFIGLTASASAQKVYFIYLQNDNASPFYVKLGDKIHSSSNSGYLILSNLVDSTYQITVGFPSGGAESKFRLSVEARDRGYLIKKFEFGTGLYDLQSMTIMRPLEDESRKSGSYRKKNDEFTTLLSRASKDTSLFWVAIPAKNDIAVAEPPQKKEIKKKEETLVPARDTALNKVAKLEEKKQDTIEAVADQQVEFPVINTLITDSVNKEDKAITERDKNAVDENTVRQKKDSIDLQVTPVENKTGPVKEESTVFKKSSVKKYAESSTSEGFGLIYFDQHEKGIDTIRLLIPNPPVLLKTDESPVRDEKLFLDISSEKERSATDSIKNQSPLPEKKEAPVEEKKMELPRINCPELATESDFFKLRKVMAAEETDEAMVDQARKYFRNKCFTTEQVKNLGALFLTSAGKYLFYDAAYMHVTDREKFPSLGVEITDEYYQKRFKALIGE